jgi:hypothetical protein
MRNTTSKKTPYGIKFTVNATFPTIAEGILDVEKDSIDSCNLLALAHANHSSRSSITRVSLQHLTIGFRNEKDRATFGAKFECAKAEGNRATDSYDRGLLRAKNNSITNGSGSWVRHTSDIWFCTWICTATATIVLINKIRDE